ncbi:MAG TPA: fluoride efflux transporter CrcB [Pirellulales bacterium]|jgi:CrcB protein|nr:fluoride efflux transporter CrcB [Pirellulales bacterium]
MKLLEQYLAVGAAGSLGAMLRLAVSTFCGRWFGTAFPVGTLVINLSGSLFLGWFLTLIGQRYVVSDTLRMAVAVGFVGAYTTFSTFAYESNSLLEDGAGLKAGANLVGSVVLGLLAVRLGIWIAGR